MCSAWRSSVVLLAALLVLSSCSPSSSGGNPGPTVYQIGDTGPAGGIVFYDQGSTINGWRYLEAAPYDQNTGMQWGTQSINTGATGTAIGTGKSNTAAIVAALGTGFSYPAVLCKNFTLNGYSDWFLPSTDELGEIYTNLASKGLGDFSTSQPNGPADAGGTYWTSTQDTGNLLDAYTQDFWTGGGAPSAIDSFTSDYCHVRAVREF